MPTVSAETRIIFWIVAAIGGVFAANIGNVLAINIVYFFSKRGRPPTRRPIKIWLLLYGSLAISLIFGAFASFAPSPPVTPQPIVENTKVPEIPISTAEIISDVDRKEGKNLHLKVVAYWKTLNEAYLLSFDKENNFFIDPKEILASPLIVLPSQTEVADPNDISLYVELGAFPNNKSAVALSNNLLLEIVDVQPLSESKINIANPGDCTYFSGSWTLIHGPLLSKLSSGTIFEIWLNTSKPDFFYLPAGNINFFVIHLKLPNDALLLNNVRVGIQYIYESELYVTWTDPLRKVVIANASMIEERNSWLCQLNKTDNICSCSRRVTLEDRFFTPNP